MSLVLSLLVVLHLVCCAVALGSWWAAARIRQPSAAMADAVAGAVVTGFVLAALMSIPGITGGDQNRMKLGITFVVGLFAVVLAYIDGQKGPATSSTVWFGIPAA